MRLAKSCALLRLPLMLQRLLLGNLALAAARSAGDITGYPSSWPALCDRRSSAPVVLTLSDPPAGEVLLEVQMGDGTTLMSVDGGAFNDSSVRMWFSAARGLSHSLRLRPQAVTSTPRLTFVTTPSTVTFGSGGLKKALVADQYQYDLVWPQMLVQGQPSAYALSACGAAGVPWEFAPQLVPSSGSDLQLGAPPSAFSPSSSAPQNGTVLAGRLGRFRVSVSAGPGSNPPFIGSWSHTSNSADAYNTTVKGVLVPPMDFGNVYVGQQACLNASVVPPIPEPGSCGLVACPENVSLTVALPAPPPPSTPAPFSEKFPFPSAQLPVGGGFGGHFNAEINPGANVSVASAARAPFTPHLASQPSLPTGPFSSAARRGHRTGHRCR